MTAMMAKNTQITQTNGMFSVNALPISPSLVTPQKELTRMITERPIMPGTARWSASARTSQTQAMPWMMSFALSLVVIWELVWSL